MPRVDLVLESAIDRTPNVIKLEGMFDVPPAKKSKNEYHFDVPFDARPWSIGLIVGPSGAGKSSVARHLFPQEMVQEYGWESKKSVVDSFGAHPIRSIVEALSSVGFSSPPGWLKSYSVLSTGEKFRCTLARALMDERKRIVIDEFTSVVDRQVAQFGSFALAKAVRKSAKQLVAVTCHYDVLEWLCPDWVLEPHTGRFDWRLERRRPSIELEITRCTHSMWRLFAPHHYLSAECPRHAKCFVGRIDKQPVAFAAVIHFPHPHAHGIWKISRLVILPDYQGIGLGSGGFTSAIASILKGQGYTPHITTSHPALIACWAKSRQWHMIQAPRFSPSLGRTSSKRTFLKTMALQRRCASFEWRGSAISRPDLWN